MAIKAIKTRIQLGEERDIKKKLPPDLRACSSQNSTLSFSTCYYSTTPQGITAFLVFVALEDPMRYVVEDGCVFLMKFGYRVA